MGADVRNLIENNDENRKLFYGGGKCDKYDYMAAVGCGLIGGLIDIFFVGMPGKSMLGDWTDAQVDNAVMKFAKLGGWRDNGNTASAIGFLEKQYKVNYDQRHTADVGNAFSMNTKNHHMKSLSHSPDIFGLISSIINQFNSTSTFIANGSLITINTDTYELQGGNIISKIFCAVTNWFGHIMSDIAGSSGSRGNSGRGTGVCAPFYELFSFCNFGKFDVGKDKQDLATIAERAFKEGYDARFFITQSLPVIISDLLIKLIWAIRRHFQKGYPLEECIPSKKYSDLRTMVIVTNATLCTVDATDAAFKSGGNALLFLKNLNLVALGRLVILVVKEIFIRLKIFDIKFIDVDAFREINESVTRYLRELEKIDIEKFKKETEYYNEAVKIFSADLTLEEFNFQLKSLFKEEDLPWKGDFNTFMSNKNNRLVFK